MVAMVAPVTPDTSGDARRPDDHSGPDTPASLNNAANVFGLARYGHFCSVASELIIESMDTLSDRSSSAAQKKAAVVRVSEHIEAANLRRDGDKKKPHYRKYPHKDAAYLVPDIERDGYADDLKSYVGIGFKNTATSTITDADGLFDWDEETVKGLQASNDGCSTLESKKRKLVAYWFELLDDLKIPMKHSVSESFGIEAYLRIFG